MPTPAGMAECLPIPSQSIIKYPQYVTAFSTGNPSSCWDHEAQCLSPSCQARNDKTLGPFNWVVPWSKQIVTFCRSGPLVNQTRRIKPDWRAPCVYRGFSVRKDTYTWGRVYLLSPHVYTIQICTGILQFVLSSRTQIDISRGAILNTSFCFSFSFVTRIWQRRILDASAWDFNAPCELSPGRIMDLCSHILL